MKSLTLFLSCLLMLPFTALSAEQPKSNELIIVTLPPLSGLVAMLMPEKQSVCLLAAGADPHHFQPSPQQVGQLKKATLVLRAGRDDQGWPIRAKASQVLTLWKNQAHGWLNFQEVKAALAELAPVLSQQFPASKNQIEQQLPLALTEVDAMEKLWLPVLETLKTKGVMMQHPAWQGVMEAYEVPIWAVLESHQHGHEHGPRHLEEALATLYAHPQTVLLGSMRHSNRSLEWLSAHQTSPKPLLNLDALGTCNMPWSVLMTSNLNKLQSQQ